MTENESAPDQTERQPNSALPGADSATVPGPDAPENHDDDSTVGTGSAIALGCIAGTLLLIVIGLILVAVFALAR